MNRCSTLAPPPGLEGVVARNPTSSDYLPNFHGTKATMERQTAAGLEQKKKILGQIVPGNFGGKAAIVFKI